MLCESKMTAVSTFKRRLCAKMEASSFRWPFTMRFLPFCCALALCLLPPRAAQAADSALAAIADAHQIALGHAAGNLSYFVAKSPPPQPVTALIVLHGHPRDAGKTLAAAIQAARLAGDAPNTLLVAPLFQVPEAQSAHCRSAGVPPPQSGDALWSCSSWIGGGLDNQGKISAFAALDRLLVALKRQWPTLQTVTVAGFSAGAQFVQHYVGFAAPPVGLRVRYLVADPGSWLYFDRLRPQPLQQGRPASWRACNRESDCSFAWQAADTGQCPQANRWKYGLDAIPPWLGRSGEQARARYAAADITYAAGERDTGEARGSFYPILDKSCAAQLQGPYRLQRALAYVAYDRRFVAPQKKRTVLLAPGCAHDVSCVFPSAGVRRALFAIDAD